MGQKTKKHNKVQTSLKSWSLDEHRLKTEHKGREQTDIKAKTQENGIKANKQGTEQGLRHWHHLQESRV